METTDKIIICVGRQIGSGGHDIAQLLAKMFGCQFYDRELLNLAARESGFCEKFFEQNDEHKGFFKSVFQLHTSFADNAVYRNNFSQDSLYQFQCDAIRKAAEEGNCVFVGRTADYVLRNHKHVTNVFITADMDQRIQRVCQRRQTDRAHARKFIAEEEAHRAAYYNYYTGKKWGHSESYDVCINSSLMGIKETAKVIAHIICRRYGWDEHRIGV